MTTDYRALAQPEPEGPTDEELQKLAGGFFTSTQFHFVDFARAFLAHPTPQPIPVAERLPEAWDCLRRGDDYWCWGQERSILTGQGAARWRLMRVSSLEEEAVTWLPAHALPLPAEPGRGNEDLPPQAA